MEITETIKEGKIRIIKINSIFMGKDKDGLPTMFLTGNHQKMVLSLEFKDIISLIEISVDGLNRINNTVQQHIRTNKDKENQQLRDVLLRQYKSAKKSRKDYRLQLKEGALRDLTTTEFMQI